MNAIIVLMDTLRRDYLSCYGSERASAGLAAPVLTPNLDRFANKGALMRQAYLGSSPCMPARRELMTGRYEFPWRGWGPLEDDDLDMFSLLRSHGVKTAMVSDHYHLLERDAGNYHTGFEEWDMIRGQEHDPYVADPGIQTTIDHFTSSVYLTHQQNLHGRERKEEELYSARVFRGAADWLERNGTHERRKEQPFCLYIDCFDPHEPWDPPDVLVERFDPGYDGKKPHSPSYGPASRFTEKELRHMRALYAAETTVVDRWFGYFLDQVERLGLWEDTLIIATTDHGYYLGERGLVGKPDRVPLYPEMSRIPFMAYAPECEAGSRRSELVQLVDVFPTVLDALGIPMPTADQVEQSSIGIVGSAGKRAWDGVAHRSLFLHGKSLMSLLRGGDTRTHDLVCSAKYGDIVRLSDGEWALYLPPSPDAELYWYGLRAPGRLFGGKRGMLDKEKGRYPVRLPEPSCSLQLYHISTDPEETVDVAQEQPSVCKRLMEDFRQWLKQIGAPVEVAVRYGAELNADIQEG
ncbi:sulfatase [Paenibacillus gansuensis]|uniref:Sulfatase n=1 Tax=Paenibacillus gansuensis TaxID=306542 RepID=A0ABW5PA30_9BACL